MATLEKIRSKSVFLFVIIIVALLAFILGDFLTSGRTYVGTGTTMMKAGSAKVDYTEYQNASENLNRNGQAGQDASEMEQVILQQLLMQKLMEEQYAELGINVTDAQVSRMMTTPNPYTAQFMNYLAQQLRLPTADGAVVFDAINNPARYGLDPSIQPTLKELWANQERQLEAMLKQQAFMSLVDGLFTANELDAQSLYNDNMTTVPVQYVMATLSSVPGEFVPTDAELKAKYEELKPSFRLGQSNLAGVIEPMRAIDYIVVDIVPSADDLAMGEAEVDAVVAALNEQPGLDGLMGKAKFMHENVNVPVSKVKSNPDLRTLPDSMLAVGKVHKFALNRGNHTYTISKVQNITPEVDSIKVSMMAATSAAEADSLVQALKGGAEFAEMIVTPEGTRGAVDIWQSLVGVPEPIKEVMLTKPVGEPFAYTDAEQGGSAVYLISERKAPVDYADVTIVKYTVDPSATTVSNIKTQLNSFLASNSRGNDFSANADSLYLLQHGFVSASTPHIGTAKDTRKAVKWAMKAKEGDVSRIFENQNSYVVVAVKGVYDGEYLPYNAPQIQDYLTAEVVKDKKAAQLMEEYAGKANDLAGYAQLMNSDVLTDSTVVFTSTRVANFLPGTEYALQGEIAAAQPGVLVGPIQGANEVIVFVAGEPTTEGRPYNYDQDANAFMGSFGINIDRYGRSAVDPVLFQLLLGDRKVKNLSLNFVGDAE